MKKRTLFLGILALFAMAFVWGCGGDDDGGGTPLTPSMQEIEVPQGLIDAANAGNTYAALALSYVNIANGFTANSAYFEPPSKAIVPTKAGAVQDTTTWTYSYEGYSWTITYGTYEDANYYYWEIWFDDNGELYDNCKYIDYREAKDGTSGLYQWYSDCGTTPFWVWTWTLSALDVYTVTMESDSYSLEIVVNPDGSGTMTSYYGDLDSQAQYVFTWTSAGTGTYVYYNEDGSTNDSGSWPQA